MRNFEPIIHSTQDLGEHIESNSDGYRFYLTEEKIMNLRRCMNVTFCELLGITVNNQEILFTLITQPSYLELNITPHNH